MKYLVYTMYVLIPVLTPGCLQKTASNRIEQFGDSLYLNQIPAQPGEDTWKFIEELASPLWTRHNWNKRSDDPEYEDLSGGVMIKENFHDIDGNLITAYNDLKTFLSAGEIRTGNGEFLIETMETNDLEGESFRIEIEPGSCRIMAGHPDGIRRGIYNLEDEMLRLKGPYLRVGRIEKHPVVRRRISRCVYGPIKRPPAFRDELLDTVNYYPDQYLNRLAHEGINGLWLSVDFRDLVSTKYNPDAAKDTGRRIEKLRKTVAQNLRYGIRTYLFTIEPRAWGALPPYYQDIHVLDKYPELGGVPGWNYVTFCPMSKTAQDYLYQTVNTLFREVPGLGGMINISQGERTTTCASTVSSTRPFDGRINCPRCSGRQPWEILYASLSAMEKGMHDANPEAELISWHYMGVPAEWVYDVDANTPEGVILQFQFETGVKKTEFGRNLVGGDYWLSTPGPSESFIRQAKTAVKHGTPVSAKIQTGNSHEVASIPFVPVPSMIYRKFRAMHELGVTHTMLGWYFGNYPGLMIRAAGELSFDPFPETEELFLEQIASYYWKREDVSAVVQAYKKLAEGYGNYPLQNMMGYYGPMHDGPVWPLLLKPADAPLSPTWQIGSSTTLKPWPPSGDRIGECLWTGNHTEESMENVMTLEENVELCGRMSNLWNEGAEIFRKIEPGYANNPERIKDIGLVKALGIQFRSGYNILNFYLLREKMYNMDGRGRLNILKQLEAIIHEELILDKELLELCSKDSRLGFHSEAEGYKYFPEKIEWRMQELRKSLSKDLPELKKMIRAGAPLFPEFTGKEPSGAVAFAVKRTASPVPDNLEWQSFLNTRDDVTQWAAAYNADTLYIIISEPGNKNNPSISGVTIRVEPRRLWPMARFSFSTVSIPGREYEKIRVLKDKEKSCTVVTMPFKSIWWKDEPLHPLRIDIKIQRGGKSDTWRPNKPVTSRLVFGTDNPADLGWLVFRN